MNFQPPDDHDPRDDDQRMQDAEKASPPEGVPLGIIDPDYAKAYTMAMIERLDPGCIEVLCGQPGDKERFLKSDQLIRSGMCPNGHGLMMPLEDWGQECTQCGFSCNTLPELSAQ